MRFSNEIVSMPMTLHTSGMLGRSVLPVGFSSVTILMLSTLAKAMTQGSAEVRSFLSPTRRGNLGQHPRACDLDCLVQLAEHVAPRLEPCMQLVGAFACFVQHFNGRDQALSIISSSTFIPKLREVFDGISLLPRGNQGTGIDAVNPPSCRASIRQLKGCAFKGRDVLHLCTEITRNIVERYALVVIAAEHKRV